MGALMRATREELEVLNADPSWWPMALDEIRESGSPARLVGDHAWSYGAFIGWVRADETRSAEYDRAREDYGDHLGMQAVPIADEATPEDVAVAKLRTDTRLKVAGKLSRGRWGEKVDAIGVNLDPLAELLREISERRMAALREPRDVTPQIVPAKVSRTVPAEQTFLASEDEI